MSGETKIVIAFAVLIGAGVMLLISGELPVRTPKRSKKKQTESAA